MRAAWLILPAVLTLSACGDPLAGVERVSEGAVIPDGDSSTALPTQAELERESSVLSGLFRRRSQPETVQEQPAQTGEDVVAAESAPLEEGTDTTVAASPDASDIDAALAQAAAAEPQAPESKGVFGWLRRAAVASQAEQTEEEIPASTDEVADLDSGTADVPQDEAPVEDVKLASLGEEAITTAPPTELVEPKKRRGLFGDDAVAQSAGMELRDVVMGTRLPFGEVGRICDARPRDLGTKIEEAARKGSGYALYDSVPDSEGPRTFYVTGFSDNCARQFTASLAIFGSPEFHEQLRYGLPAKEYPYSTTDKAYEKVKKKVCNAGRNTPCGARISRLENTTVFISVYEHFGENARWADMLLHDGALLAAAVKTP